MIVVKNGKAKIEGTPIDLFAEISKVVSLVLARSAEDIKGMEESEEMTKKAQRDSTAILLEAMLATIANGSEESVVRGITDACAGYLKNKDGYDDD